MAIARLSVKVGKVGKAAPHAEYIDRDEEKKLKQEQAETDLEHSAYGNMPKWAEHNQLPFGRQPIFTSAKWQYLSRI